MQQLQKGFLYHLSLFNWFLGILLIFSGLGYFLFPDLAPAPQLLPFLGYIKLIKIFLIISGGALIFLGSNRLRNTISEKFFYSLICVLNVFLILILLKTNDPLAIATNGILTVFLLIFLIYKFLDLTKIILLINGWVVGSGIVFYFRPDFLEFTPLVYWINNNLFLFAAIWILGIFFLVILSRLSLKGNKTALLIFSLITAISSLIISILTLTVDINDITLYSAVLSIFSFSLPIWLYIEPLGLLSRKKLLNAFSWWLVIIIIGTVLSFYTQNLFKVFLTTDLGDRAKDSAKAMESYLNERVLAVSGFQESGELIKLMSTEKKDQTALENKLKELYLASRKFLRIVVIDKNNKIISTYPRDLSLIGQQPIIDQIPYISGKLNTADGSFLGTISGIVDIADINDLLQDFKYNDQTNFLIIDDKKNILIGDKTKTMQGQGGAIEAFATVNTYNWQITVEQPFVNLSGGNRTIASIVFLTSIISAVSSLLIMLYLDRKKIQ